MSSQRQQFIIQAKKILANVTVHEILKRKSRFRGIDLKKISDDDLFKEIKKVLEIYVEGQPFQVSLISSRFIGQPHVRTLLYRVRKLTDLDISHNDFVSMRKPADAWYPPSQFVSQGRLNKIGESLLYLAEDPKTAIIETHLQPGDLFYLIVFRTGNPFRATFFEESETLPELSDDENAKLQLFNDFLISEFVKHVGKGTEYLYRTSEIIAKQFLCHRDLDVAWSYPSIANSRRSNLCFKSEIAYDHLDLVGVRVCRLVNQTDYRLGVIGDAIEVDKSGNFIYVSAKSKISQETFAGFNAAFNF